jgi:hypothetical protein
MPANQQVLLGTSSGNGLSALVNEDTYIRDPGSPAGVKFLLDGTVQYKGPASSYTYTYTWRTGTADSSLYEIRATLTSGDTVSAGTLNTWQALSSTRTWERSAPTTDVLYESTLLIEIRMAAAPNTVLDSATVILSAFLEGCPLCCFSPGTLIAMTSVDYKKIEDIKVGDTILTSTGVRTVSEVIVREQRDMFLLEFSDGTTIEASDDHPFFVKDKGYASLNPTVPYKDIGVPAVLKVGDRVKKLAGESVRLVKVTSIPCPEKVYTFAESGFYANGLLVY